MVHTFPQRYLSESEPTSATGVWTRYYALNNYTMTTTPSNIYFLVFYYLILILSYAC